MRIHMKNILCATDLSGPGNRTLSYGIGLAREFGSKLSVCHVIEMPATAVYGEAFVDPVEQQQISGKLAMEQIHKLMEGVDLEWEPIIAVGHASDEINRMVEQHRIDLVVSATHGRSGLKRLVLGSVTERLMRTLPCPLLVISARSGSARHVSYQGFQKILIGCDFSKMSNFALRFAVSLAQELASELHMAHVVEAYAYRESVVPEIVSEDEMQRVLNEFLEKRLAERVPEEAFHWCSPKTVLLDGRPDEALSIYARNQEIDLIVLGTRGQGLVETFLLGSTTDRLVRRAECPVLSVCPNVFRNESEDEETRQ
jgi:nucleotide-binding universal stress UspA family protein